MAGEDVELCIGVEDRHVSTSDGSGEAVVQLAAPVRPVIRPGACGLFDKLVRCAPGVACCTRVPNAGSGRVESAVDCLDDRHSVRINVDDAEHAHDRAERRLWRSLGTVRRRRSVRLLAGKRNSAAWRDRPPARGAATVTRGGLTTDVRCVATPDGLAQARPDDAMLAAMVDASTIGVVSWCVGRRLWAATVRNRRTDDVERVCRQAAVVAATADRIARPQLLGLQTGAGAGVPRRFHGIGQTVEVTSRDRGEHGTSCGRSAEVASAISGIRVG